MQDQQALNDTENVLHGLFFKPIKYMNTICVIQFLYYKSMMRILCSKPSYFCANKLYLYPRNIVGVLIKIIFFRGGVFLNNRNDVYRDHLHETHDL